MGVLPSLCMVCFFHQPAQQWFLGENGKQRRAQLCSGRWCWPRWYFNNERSRLDVTNKRKNKKQKNNKATKTTNNPWKGPSVFNLGGRHGSKRISFAQILPRVPVPHKPAFQGKYRPIDGQYQMLSSKAKAVTADIWDLLQHMRFPLPALALHCRIWVTVPVLCSDSDPFIVNPSITNQTAMRRLRQLFLIPGSYNSSEYL